VQAAPLGTQGFFAAPALVDVEQHADDAAFATGRRFAKRDRDVTIRALRDSGNDKVAADGENRPKIVFGSNG